MLVHQLAKLKVDPDYVDTADHDYAANQQSYNTRLRKQNHTPVIN